MGLAREGLEAVRNMRDTNWLNDTLSTSCYDFHTASQVGSCYPNWRFVSGFNDLRGNASGKTFTVGYNPITAPFWTLNQQSSDFTLLFDSSGSSGFYKPGSGTPASGYFRKVILTDDSTAPYFNTDLGPRIKVTVQVWWQDKNCPQATQANFPSNGACRIQLETYLTNWKNY
jgi:hypothetical protein